jgi:hypothetical protein
MPLTDPSRWTKVNGSIYFTGALHVEIGPFGQPVFAWTSPDIPVKCLVVPKSEVSPVFVYPTASPAVIDFEYHFLDCKFPSITDTAYDLGYPKTHTIYDHADFWDLLAGNNVNMVILANLDPNGSGVFFMHRSLVLEKTVVDDSNNQTASMLMFDDLGISTTGPISSVDYYETPHSYTIPASPDLRIEVIPDEIHWNGMIETRPGQNLAWWMDDARFTLGEGFDGWMGDFWIDPKTGQTTGT